MYIPYDIYIPYGIYIPYDIYIPDDIYIPRISLVILGAMCHSSGLSWTGSGARGRFGNAQGTTIFSGDLTIQNWTW